MMKVEENVGLKAYNTFGIDVKAKYLCRVAGASQMIDLVQSPFFKEGPHYVLGGGSNVLFTRDFDGLIIKNELKGIEIVRETDSHVVVKASSGEDWHGFVLHAVARGWGGVENLSLIPGTVGAAPMQNIGAYGVEVKNVIEEVGAIELSTGNTKTFAREECAFGYRESVFKKGLAKKYFISSVTLRLTKKNHLLNTTYGALEETLTAMGVGQPTLQSISRAVVHIRKENLPDPAVVGNAGSFFKNPTLPVGQFNKLQSTHATMPGYPIDNQNIKVPAGWLIEQCGWKGKRVGNIGVHPRQALVLVNYGGGTGQEILSLSEEIQAAVMDKFQIGLKPEVNIL